MRGTCFCDGVLRMNDHPSEQVRKRYADAALQVLNQEKSSAAVRPARTPSHSTCTIPVSPRVCTEEALLASLGFGNPKPWRS